MTLFINIKPRYLVNDSGLTGAYFRLPHVVQTPPLRYHEKSQQKFSAKHHNNYRHLLKCTFYQTTNAEDIKAACASIDFLLLIARRYILFHSTIKMPTNPNISLDLSTAYTHHGINT